MRRYMKGANEIGPLKPTAMVWPSSLAFAAASTPSMPPAPGLLSTTTAWGQRSLSLSASRRATTSSELPAGAGTTMCTGRFGQAAWAWAASGNAADKARDKARDNKVRREVIGDQ